jgi:GT2 family glycosyltransferase/glycosyltransferase involved in cell wall biosynthesis
MTENDSSGPPICIVIPFENQTDVAASFLKSLAACREELQKLRCELILVDSSNEADSDSLVNEFLGRVPYVHLHNEESHGFSHAANLGLKQTVDRHADVILLHPDSLVSPGAFHEMQRVAYLDSMIGFVSPRSNAAGISSFPPQEEFQKTLPDAARSIFKELSNYLPELQYVPAASATCVFIKLEVLREFGLFDESYETSDDATNDLVMRANQCGYRAALANHAFVYHSGPGAPSLNEDEYGQRVASRYQEYKNHLNDYFRSANRQAEVLLAGLLKDERGRYEIVFDFSSFGTYHNGTFEAAKQILVHALSWEGTFQIYVLVDDEPARYHGLDRIPRIVLVPSNTTKVFAIAFRFGQPFDHEAIIRMSRLAACNVYSMLDPIAWDCLYLHRQELDELWRAVFSFADAVIYLSDFVAKQFHLRLRSRPGMKELVAYPSLDPCDYGMAPDELSSAANYLLVVGNAFAHKNLRPTVEILSREFPREKIVALGLEEGTLRNVIGYKSGHLSDDLLHDLFFKARAVIFPSFYEGFGIPIVRGLAYQKPVLARSTQINRDLFQRLGRPDYLILYDCNDDLISRLRQGWPSWRGPAAAQPDRHDWAASAKQIGEFLSEVVQEVSYTDVLIPRLEHMNLLCRIAKLKKDQSPMHNDVEFLQLQKEVSELRIAVRDKDLQLRGLFSSLSWAVTSPMRKLGGLWLRVFSNKTRKRSS